MQTPKLTLPTLLAGIVLALLPLTGAQAAPLNPGSFASLGNNPFTQTGTYTVDTGATPPTLSGPGISSPIRGVVSSAGAAVFTFRSITLPQGATLSAVRGTARPLALLSQGDEDIEGTIDVSGANGGQGGPDGGNGGADSANGNGSPGGSVEAGGGGAGGQAGPQFSVTTYGGGGGFGGAGGKSGSTSGQPYGNLLTKLEGGSGGGGAGAQEIDGPYSGSYSGGPGGGGGGAVELGAEGTVTLAGGVNASGGEGGAPSGGGGAGGGILVHGTDVAVTAAPLTLSAHGGYGISEDGGGGRIVLEADGGFITGDIDNTIFLYGADNINGQIKTVGTVVPYAEDNSNVQVPHRSASGVNVTLTASSARPNGSETDTLDYSLLGASGGAQHGTVTLSGSTATYKPNVAADYVGTDTFRFTVYDSTENLPGSHTGAITVTLTNAAPAVSTPTISPAAPRTIDTIQAAVTASDADSDPITLTYVWKDGTVVEQTDTTSNLSDTYTGPRAAGDVLTVTVTPKDPHTSGTAKSASATVTVTATAVSLSASPSPAAVGQSVTVTASAAATGGSALPAGAGTLAVYIDNTSVGSSASGTVIYSTSSLSAGRHTVVAAFTPADSTRYAYSNASQTFFVFGNPIANDQTVNVAFSTATTITLSGSDPNVPALPLTYSINSAPAHGSLSGFNASTGAVTYTPTAAYHGADSFQFTVNNSVSTSTAAAVSLTVATGVPTANSQSAAVAFNTAKAVTLTGSDPDVPALPLTYTIATGPAHGTLTGTAPNLTYTPAASYYGADSFTFTVSNGTSTSAPAIVSLTVAQGAATDVTAQITLTRGGFRYVRATGHYLQPVTLTNTGAALLDPISLVLDGLSGATLVGASGTTATALPSGSPYVTLPTGGLAAGASVTVTLEFTAQPTGYSARVLAGPGAH